MPTKSSLLYQIAIFLSIGLALSGLFFSLDEIKQIENEQLSASILLAQNQEIDRKIIQIKKERAEYEARKQIEQDILPSGDSSLELSAKAFILISIAPEARYPKIVYQKNAYEKLPVASLSKLMTALIVLENYKLDDAITISKEAVATEGDAGGLQIGERLIVLDLLKIMLIESSNDAAEVLAENFNVTRKEIVSLNRERFIELMNQKARALGLENTHFSNPTGLDDPENYSTAYDLAKFVSSILNQNLLWEITQTKTEVVYSVDAKTGHFLKNSNQLLWQFNGSTGSLQIYGGKTGFTNEAKGCMILVLKTSEGYLVSVVLGSEDRIEDTTKLINSKF